VTKRCPDFLSNDSLIDWSFTGLRKNLRGASKAFCSDQARSKRSRFITFVHAATKSFANFSFESAHA